MASRLSELIVKITADSKQFQSEMGKLSRSAQSAGSALMSVGLTMTASLTAPLAGFGIAALRASADMEALKAGLTSVTGSAAKTEEQLKRLKEVAKLPGLGFREAVQGSINLQAAGYSANLAERALKGFGNALATVGKGKADLDGVITALSQIASKGKISAEEINQLAERLPQIRTAMKAAFGTADTEALQKMGIDAQEFVDRITKEFEKLPPVTGGLKNNFENLRDRIEQSLVKAGDSIKPFAETALQAFDAIVERIGRVAEAFSGLPAPVKGVSVALLGTFAIGGPLLIGLGQTVFAIGQIAGALSKAKEGAALLTGAIAKLGIALKAASFVGLAAALYTLFDALNDKDKVSTTTKALDHLNATLGQNSEKAAGNAKAIDTLLAHIKSLDGGTRSAAVGAKELDAAFATLGFKTSKQLTEELNKAQVALKTVEQAYHAGQATALDVAHAQEVVKAAFESLHGAAEKVATNIKAIPFAEKSPEAALLVMQVERLAKQAEEAGRASITLKESWDAFNALNFERDFSLMAGAVGDKMVEAALKSGAAIETLKTDLGDLELALARVKISDDLGTIALKIESGQGDKDVKRALDALKPTITDAQKRFKDFGREVSTIFNDLGRGIADAVVEWKGFGSLVENVAKDIAKALIRWAIKEGIMKVSDALGGLGGIASRVGKTLGDIFGGAGSVASTAASTAGTVASQAGGAVSTAGSAAGTGIGSVVGMVTGAVSAVTGVIGNFQMSGMNKSLDLIVKHTLETASQLLAIQFKLNDHLPFLNHIHAFHYGPHMAILNAINDSIRAGGGGGDGRPLQVIVQIEGRTIAQQMVRDLKLAGA